MSDDFDLGMLVGIIVMGVVGFALITLIGMGNNHALVERHPGIQDLIGEMRDDCERRPGVVECEWDKNELNFVEEAK